MEPKLPVPQLVLAGNSSSGLKKMKVENLKDLHLEFIILGGCMTSMFFFSGVTSREVGLVSHDDLINILQTNCLTVNGKCVRIFVIKHVCMYASYSYDTIKTFFEWCWQQ